MKLPSLRLLAYVWTAWAGLCAAATITAWREGEPVGFVLSAACLVCSIALGLYCWRGLDRP